MTVRVAFKDTALLSWLMLVFMRRPATISGQGGVFLQLNGVRLTDNSLVDIDDIPDDLAVGFDMARANALMCVTDLMDCCNAGLPDVTASRGVWYHPDGSEVTFDAGSAKFRRNRGQSEIRLWRSGNPIQRGRFRCVLPDTQMVNQTRYFNILDIGAVSVSPAGTTTMTVGENFNLQCSVVIAPNPLPENVPTPNLEWFFGVDNASFPSGVTVSPATGSGNTYTTTLQFSPLRESHAGMYTCQLQVGANTRRANSAMTTVNRPSIIVTVTHERGPELGGMYVLTCALSGSERLSPTVTYQWTRDNGTTQTVGTNSMTLSFSPLSLSDAGQYTCSVTVSSPYLNSDVLASAGNSQTVMFQIPAPMVIITSNPPSPIRDGTDVTLTCSVTIDQRVLSSDLSLLMVDTQLSRDGTTLPLSDRMVTGTTFTYTIQLNSFGRNDSGNYVCTATVTPQQPSTYLTGMGRQTVRTEIVVGIPTTESPMRGNNAAAIAGGIVVVLIALAAVSAALIFFVIWWRRRRLTVPYKQPPQSKHAQAPVAYTRSQMKGDVLLTGVARVDTPQILKFPSDTNITEGEGVYFKIKVSGVPLPTVTWYHDGEPVTMDYAREIEADGSLAIPSAELKHSGVYKAVVANQHGSEEMALKLTVNEDGGASTAALSSNGVVSSRPIPISNFGQYVAELHANSNQPFKDLYQSLDTGEEGHSISYATNRERKPLNRFGNIVVYDDNRIALTSLPGSDDCQRDYINACYVDGYSVPNKFIATQGPLPKTVVDFWRLIWQERPPTVVMVTNVKEGNRIKCQQYWPESGKKDFGPFQVTITDQQVFADYTIRTLSVSLGFGRSHKVTQYHFTAWPDHGVPDYATPILAFHRRVKAQHHPSRGPMVVHCSAGVGRTGTLIVIDNILEQIEKEQVVDIPGAITKIRQKRMKMVQTHEQFTFIHDAILESVTCGDTQISATNLRPVIAKMKKKDTQNQPYGFHYQFKILEQVSPNPEEVHCGGALTYPDRSRSDKYLPADRWRVVLKGEQPDYIHAVNINGYKHKRAFIVAEGPMQSTVRNFWKMVYDRKCAVVVMVSGLVEEGEESSAQYWPGSGIARFGEYAVDMLGEEHLEGFTIRNLSVMDTKTQQAHHVTQFHITCWTPDGHCSNLKSVTDVIEEMTKVQIRSGNKPIVVHCNDTVTRSGMFCSIATTIERCKTEGVVDVFQVVKALRVQKPGAVPTVDNYKLIFNGILVYLESFDTYANFQNI